MRRNISDTGSYSTLLFQALHSILSQSSPDDPKAVERQRELNPSLLQQLIQSNFQSSMVMPTLTVDTVSQLKDIISNTLATASNFLEGSGSSEVHRLFIYLYSAVP